MSNENEYTFSAEHQSNLEIENEYKRDIKYNKFRINPDLYIKIYFVISTLTILVDIFFNVPKWVWFFFVFLALIVFLAMYEPEKKITWIWNLKHKIFKESESNQS